MPNKLSQSNGLKNARNHRPPTVRCKEQLPLADISHSDAKRTLLKKEVAISLLNGFLFAIIMGVIAYIWFNKGMLGVVIALSMIIIYLWQVFLVLLFLFF